MSENLQKNILFLLSRGETQKQVAKRLNVSERTIRRWKSGEVKNPSKQHAKKINRVVGGVKSIRLKDVKQNKVFRKGVQRVFPDGKYFKLNEIRQILDNAVDINEDLDRDDAVRINYIYETFIYGGDELSEPMDINSGVFEMLSKSDMESVISDIEAIPETGGNTAVTEIRIDYGQIKTVKASKNKTRRKKPNRV